jgi:hypothetical protein
MSPEALASAGAFSFLSPDFQEVPIPSHLFRPLEKGVDLDVMAGRSDGDTMPTRRKLFDDGDLRVWHVLCD